MYVFCSVVYWIILIAYDGGKFKASETEDNKKDQWYTEYLLRNAVLILTLIYFLFKDKSYLPRKIHSNMFAKVHISWR